MKKTIVSFLLVLGVISCTSDKIFYEGCDTCINGFQCVADTCGCPETDYILLSKVSCEERKSYYMYPIQPFDTTWDCLANLELRMDLDNAIKDDINPFAPTGDSVTVFEWDMALVSNSLATNGWLGGGFAGNPGKLIETKNGDSISLPGSFTRDFIANNCPNSTILNHPRISDFSYEGVFNKTKDTLRGYLTAWDSWPYIKRDSIAVTFVYP